MVCLEMLFFLFPALLYITASIQIPSCTLGLEGSWVTGRSGLVLLEKL